MDDFIAAKEAEQLQGQQSHANNLKYAETLKAQTSSNKR